MGAKKRSKTDDRCFIDIVPPKADIDKWGQNAYYSKLLKCKNSMCNNKVRVHGKAVYCEKCVEGGFTNAEG